MKDLITIREYNEKDYDSVIGLLRMNTPKFFAPGEEVDFERYLEAERELYYVLLSEEVIVGCGGINFDDNKTTGKISWDIFHPDYQGKGLGSQLLNFRIQKLKTIDGIKRIIVRTSQIAYTFYEKRGFELLEVVKDYWGQGFDLYTMEYNKRIN